jgi:hypothetical protein
MLGSRRAGVTVALNHFVKTGLLASQRGHIEVVNRRSLEEAANGSYGASETEYRRLFKSETPS